MRLVTSRGSAAERPKNSRSVQAPPPTGCHRAGGGLPALPGEVVPYVPSGPIKFKRPRRLSRRLIKWWLACETFAEENLRGIREIAAPHSRTTLVAHHRLNDRAGRTVAFLRERP